jgi:hypothetical protein
MRAMHRTAVAGLFLVLCADFATARNEPRALELALQAEAPSMVLEDLSGAIRRLPLAELELGNLAASDVLFLRPEGLDVPTAQPSEESAWLQLVGGDRVHARVRGGAGDLLRVELLGQAEWVVSVERIVSLVFSARVSAEVQAGLAPAERGDVLFWLRDGGDLDRVPGTLIEFSAEGPRLESSFGARTYPWNEVAALFIEVLEEPEPRASETELPGLRAGARVGLDLIDGGRLHGVLRALDAGSCRVETAPGRELTLPLGAVAELAADDGRARYLSELEPELAEEGSSFGDDLGLVWRHRRDGCVTGGPLRAGGRTWRRGLGVHAPSRLTWELDGSWTELRGAVAIDDQVLMLAARGSVIFRVQVDGEQRFESPVVHGGDPPVEFPPIALKGARKLTLEVDMDGDHFVADRADWLRLLLVRSP